MRVWSTRRAAITTRHADLAAAFQAEHGRPPTAVEAIDLAQQATLETRHAKHAPRSEAEQRATWRREAVAVLGEDGLGRMLDTVTHPTPKLASPTFGAAEISAIAGDVVAAVSAQRATWQVWHVRAETERQARTHNVPLAIIDAVVERVVQSALGEHSIPLTDADPVPVPAALRRADGSSVYRVAGSDVYTSPAILTAEQHLLELARHTDGRADRRRDRSTWRCWSPPRTASPSTTAKPPSSAPWARPARWVQLALAPAGTGKTTALRVLARAWAEDGGTVLGLAPSAAAAACSATPSTPQPTPWPNSSTP